MYVLTRRARVLLGADWLNRREQQIEQPLFGHLPRFLPNLDDPLLTDHVHGELHEVADHRLHVTSDVADFRELRRLDLDER